MSGRYMTGIKMNVSNDYFYPGTIKDNELFI